MACRGIEVHRPVVETATVLSLVQDTRASVGPSSNMVIDRASPSFAVETRGRV